MDVLDRPAYYGFKQRHEPQLNAFGLKCCDHFGLPTPDPERAGKFYEQILGAVELFRAGYSEDDRAKKRLRHIFYHIGATLIELVEQEDGISYPDHTNPEGRNMNPHFAWQSTAEGVAKFAAHLTAQGIPFSGPRRHVNVSAVSVYFRDQDGNNLEVTTWEECPDEMIAPANPNAPRGKSGGFMDWGAYAHNWRPKD
jgi:catechol 2,3-dioxygenase-like lactoylglutathione lyase family enzyme